ncbi:MAG: ArnT family glycosyltransferase [Planctomycetota bacterium]
MRIQTRQIEALGVATLLCLGALLRLWCLNFEAVEHFDEGIYGSVLWYDAQFGTAWPGREYFAPAGLPFLIELASLVPGISDYAPFVPALVSGMLTPLVFWWTARFWFGRSAALFVLAIVTCSEFHVIYSRMALTDVPALCLVVASVGVASFAIQRGSARWSLVAGFLCGLAWWIKYTGWLPLAIVASGSVAWWLSEGRGTPEGRRLPRHLAMMAFAAVATFLPCWWSLQSIGGYAAVASNHAGYLAGWQQWSDRLSEQLAFQMQLDGLWGAASLATGLGAAAVVAAVSWLRFTWNASPMSDGPATTGDSVRDPQRVLRTFWFRAISAAAGLGLLCLRIHTPIMLGCLALGGLSGRFLWPGPGNSARPARLTSDSLLSAEPGEGRGLGFWLSLAWVSGLLLATPFYQPYSRLMFPLIAGIWLAAAGGVSWWLDCQLMISGPPPRLSRPLRAAQIAGRVLLIGLLGMAAGGSLVVPDGNGNPVLVSLSDLSGSSPFEDRRDIRRAARDVAEHCVLHVLGTGKQTGSVEVDTVFTASRLLQLRNTADAPALPPTTEQLRSTPAVLCVYGEPALAGHLHSLEMAAVPIAQPAVEARGDGTAVFLIFGPNAKRTPGFWEQWQAEETRFEWVGDVIYQPGRITLMDLYSAEYLSEHAEVLQQRFEIYRVRDPRKKNPEAIPSRELPATRVQPR